MNEIFQVRFSKRPVDRDDGKRRRKQRALQVQHVQVEVAHELHLHALRSLLVRLRQRRMLQ